MYAIRSYYAARGGGKTEVMPVQTTAPAAVVIETTGGEVELRKQLRTKNGVVELSAPKSPFSQAPTGSFGFIAPQFLGMALVTQSPDLLLERVAPSANAYEIHKLADGSGMLVGFIGKDLIPQVTPADRPRITSYNVCYTKLLRAVLHWRDFESAAFPVVEYGGEDARRIEVGPTEPVDGSVNSNQGGCPHVADEAVIFDRLVAHECLRISPSQIRCKTFSPHHVLIRNNFV